MTSCEDALISEIPDLSEIPLGDLQDGNALDAALRRILAGERDGEEPAVPAHDSSI